jgi:CBS domain-containing protein
MTTTLSTRSGSYLTPSFQHALVSDAMRPRVMTCSADAPLVDVARLMSTEHIHAVVVLREHGDVTRPWGIVTDFDVLRCADRIDTTTAGEAAAGPLVTARTDASLADAAHEMGDRRATHAIVVSPRDGRPVGVLSSLDIAGILAWGRG